MFLANHRNKCPKKSVTRNRKQDLKPPTEPCEVAIPAPPAAPQASAPGASSSVPSISPRQTPPQPDLSSRAYRPSHVYFSPGDMAGRSGANGLGPAHNLWLSTHALSRVGNIWSSADRGMYGCSASQSFRWEKSLVHKGP